MQRTVRAGAGRFPESNVIVLDTSVRVDSLTGEKRSTPALRRVFERGERAILPALVYYEWSRGPRLRQEVVLAERLFPRESAIVFGLAEAALSERLYRSVRHPRGLQMNLAIAACAIVREAQLWTLNPNDFRDIPELRLYDDA